MNQLTFVKMESTGNDFIVVDNRQGLFDHLDKNDWEKLCHRKLGVGADGVLMVENPKEYPEADFKMKYLNADGAEETMCGNGARAIASFARFEAWD